MSPTGRHFVYKTTAETITPGNLLPIQGTDEMLVVSSILWTGAVNFSNIYTIARQ